MYIIQFMSDNPLISIIVSLAGIITSTALAIVFGIKRKKKVYYVVKTDVLISDFSNTIKGIDITHDGNEIKSLCVSKIYIWNGGKPILEKTDFHQSRPLKIVIDKSCTVLGANHVSETNETCGFKLGSIDENNHLVIQFDCLESGYGGVFQIIHTVGELSSTRKLLVNGDIKGKGRVIEFENEDKDNDKTIVFRMIIGLVVSVIFALFLVLIQQIVRLFQDAFNIQMFSLIIGLLFGYKLDAYKLRSAKKRHNRAYDCLLKLEAKNSGRAE